MPGLPKRPTRASDSPIQPALPLRQAWTKPSGKQSDPPPEQGKILAVCPREAWNGGQSTEVHLTYNQMESGGDYGRAQEWKLDDQGRAWPVPKGGITIRRGEIQVWLEYLTQLKAEFDAHPKPQKRGAR